MRQLLVTQPILLALALGMHTAVSYAAAPDISPAPQTAVGGVTLADDVDATGFRKLFNGKDLTGWDGNPKLWSVKDGAISGETTAQNPATINTFLIWTNGVVGDFELECSFRLVANNSQNFCNSGIQYRSKVLDPKVWSVGGYQADMEAGPTYTGILYEERMSRGIMAARGEKVTWDKDCNKQVTGTVGDAAAIQASIKKGEWNRYRIVAKGNHLQHFVNGMQTVDVTDDCESKRSMTGVLALQLHVGQPMLAQFKDIRLKAGSTKGNAAAAAATPEFDGEWRVMRGEANGEELPAENITNLVLSIKGGRYTVMNGNETQDKGSFSADTSSKPLKLDIHPESGPIAGRTLKAIYELNGDDFKVCYAIVATEHPKSFADKDEPGNLVMYYKRIKK
jgi:uncharacterized protein (TIGR03067 family)